MTPLLMSSQTPLSSQPHRRRPWLFISIIAGLLIVVILADVIVGSICRARLAAIVRQKLGLELESSFAWYLPPVGVSLHRVHLFTAGQEGGRIEVFNASRVVLQLKERPREGKPISLDRFMLTGGRLNYSAAGRHPLEMEAVDLELVPAAGAAQVYQFSLSADQNSIRQVHGTGSINAESLILTLTDISVRTKISALLEQAPFSPQVRQHFLGSEAGGTVDIHGNATIPLRDWSHGTYAGNVHLLAGKLNMPVAGALVDAADANMDIHGTPEGGFHVAIKKMTATGGATIFDLADGEFVLSPDRAHWDLTGLLGRLEVGGGVPALDRLHVGGRWRFTAKASGPTHFPKDASWLSVVSHEVVAYPRDVAIQPPKYPIPIDHINGGPVTFRGGVIQFTNLIANYGGDRVLLDTGHITLDDPKAGIALKDLRRQVRIDGLNGTLVCKQPGPAYPAGLGKVIAQLRPAGSYAITGWYAINRKLPTGPPKPKPDYFFRVSTADGTFLLTDHRVSLSSMHADATISPMLVNIGSLRGETLGGTMMAAVKITPVRPVSYDGVLTLYNVNAERVFHDFEITLKKPLVGQAYVKVHATGSGRDGPVSPLKTLAMDGELAIVNGNFGNINPIHAIASTVTKVDPPLDGQAAATFTIRDETVTLLNCAVGNPVFGLQGSGNIGFDKTLNLHAVAAPLGDWGQALKQSNLPLIDSVGSTVVGSIQQIFNGAQRTLLWDIRISGTTHSPSVYAVPAPIITEPVAAIFGQMLQGEKKTPLIEQVRRKK